MSGTPGRASVPIPGTTGEGAVATGQYPNAFAALGHTEAEIQAKLDGAFQSLFHGDPGSETVYYVTDVVNEFGPMAQIRDINSNDIRSEGISYGLMIAVQLDRQEEFNALWNWAKAYMYHKDPNHPGYRYFSWHTNYEGRWLDPMPAPDGEEYIATALYFASGRWGNGTGIYDYRAQADELLDAIKNRGRITGKGKTTEALFNPDWKQVRFTPDTDHFASHGDHTDPSYHLPAFYELWALWGPEADRPFWKEAAKASRDLFVLAAHPQTGLVPDYSTFDGQPVAAQWDANTVNFRFDAWRTAMNWTVDWVWWKADPREQELSERLLAFFRTQGRGYANQYSLAGVPQSSDYSSGLEAMNAVATLATTKGAKDYEEFLAALWDREPPKGPYRYYDGMLYLFGLLHVSGNFRAYAPQ